MSESAAPPRKPRYAKWRVATLVAIHILIAAHVVHWLIFGRTLAPLEISEILRTLHHGVVTAGFVFMVAIVLSVLVFGRFFCGWACHLLALQDLCSWVTGRLGVALRPARSRALAMVPFAAMLYLFAWPQATRLLAGERASPFRIASDAEGWGSFVTEDFWRNLPGPWISILTLVVCGALIVLFLGHRGFCRYACPYGALFGLADRVAPSRIVVSGDCTQCGVCTAGCRSGVRVHEEVRRFGMIVNPGCIKDLDCIDRCPNGALTLGVRRPRPLLRRAAGSKLVPFSWPSEALIAAVALGTLLATRDLYGAVPFLLALAIGTIAAYCAAIALQLRTGAAVRLGPLRLRSRGSLTRPGRVFMAAMGVAGVIVLHSGVVRYHEYRGRLAFERVATGRPVVTATLTPELRARVDLGIHHLERARTVGVFVPASRHRRLASLYEARGDEDDARTHLLLTLAKDPEDLVARLRLGELDARRGAVDSALLQLRAVTDSHARRSGPLRAAAHEALAGLARARGDHATALDQLQRAVEADPHRTSARIGLGASLARAGALEDARMQILTALVLDPKSVDGFNNLGAILHALGRDAPALAAFERASSLDPGSAAAHANRGAVLLGLGRMEAAKSAFELALALDPNDVHASHGLRRILSSSIE